MDNFDNLKELLAQAQSKVQDSDGVAEIILRVAAYNPLNWQAVVKHRDANLTWGVFVSPDPEEAVTRALGIALRGEEARRSESRALFHEKKDKAKAFAELLEMEYEDQILLTKVEFEPYKGFVVVVFPKPGVDTSVFPKNIEVRQAEGSRAPAGGKPVRIADGETKPQRTRSSTPAEVKEGRAALTKDKLEAEYKSLFGKQPDRNIKKADLAKLLDDEEDKRLLGA